MTLDPPRFPVFKPLELADRDVFQERLWAYRPDTSELNFTNLFIWQAHYQVEWCLDGEILVCLCDRRRGPYLLPPIGPGSRLEAVARAFEHLRRELGIARPRIERADRRLADELAADPARYRVEPAREHFDYLYPAEQLIRLSGKKLHAKRNHINRFLRSNRFEYLPVAAEHVPACLELAEAWCGIRECVQDMGLTDEWGAVRSALGHLEALRLQGGVIRVEGRLQAFSLGEWLNPETAVIHVEKANPEIPELYPLINQQFCEHAWQAARWINREQDLGEENLRKAKLSYHPERLVEKFRIDAV